VAKHVDAPGRQLSQSLPSEVFEDLPDGIDEQGGAATAPRNATADMTPMAHVAPTENTNNTDSQRDSNESAAPKRPRSRVRLALVFGIVGILALTALAGWLGCRGYQAHQAMQQRELFLQVARQGALNLTTISYTEVDADVRRILDSATGTFHDDFQNRSQPFIDVVKQAQSKSVGTITAAGLESVDGGQAQALVAVHVTTSNAGAAEQPPRAWRMRIDVQKVGHNVKVSNVQFVP
jgi:Mce-associated membrane protein